MNTKATIEEVEQEDSVEEEVEEEAAIEEEQEEEAIPEPVPAKAAPKKKKQRKD